MKDSTPPNNENFPPDEEIAEPALNLRNIHRYTYEDADFMGWRFSIQRKGKQLTRYFPDRKYGSEEAALQAALRLRDAVLAALARPDIDPGDTLDNFRNE